MSCEKKFSYMFSGSETATTEHMKKVIKVYDDEMYKLFIYYWLNFLSELFFDKKKKSEK